MAAKSNPKILSREEERALNEDILVRLELQKIEAENTRRVLQAEFGVCHTNCTSIEQGRYNVKSRTLSPEAVLEIRRRRRKFWLARERMPAYTIAALAKKYGTCSTLIVNRINGVKDQLAAQNWRAAYQHKDERREAA